MPRSNSRPATSWSAGDPSSARRRTSVTFRGHPGAWGMSHGRSAPGASTGRATRWHSGQVRPATWARCRTLCAAPHRGGFMLHLPQRPSALSSTHTVHDAASHHQQRRGTRPSDPATRRHVEHASASASASRDIEPPRLFVLPAGGEGGTANKIICARSQFHERILVHARSIAGSWTIPHFLQEGKTNAQVGTRAYTHPGQRVA